MGFRKRRRRKEKERKKKKRGVGLVGKKKGMGGMGNII